MPKIKLTKTAVDAATAQERDYELRDTMVPGFLVKVTPTGRKTFMLAYVANNGQRRKPAIGRYGELTVDQARNIAQDWLVVTGTPVPAAQPAPALPSAADVVVTPTVEAAAAQQLSPDGKPLGFEDGSYTSRTRVGNYRPYRHRSGENRSTPPGKKRAQAEEASHA